jgi:hypothetical protein
VYIAGSARNTNIGEELNILVFNLNNKILKYRSQWKHHVVRMEERWFPKKTLTYNPKRRRK